MKQKNTLLLTIIAILLLSAFSYAVNYPYDGAVSRDVKRDRIMAIAEDYNTLYYYVSEENIDTDTCPGSICPDPVVGWKTGMKYCWGGEDTTKQYLLRLTEDDIAGNKWCSSPSGTSYDACSAGADCSGFVSNAWTSPRYSTAGFHNISDNITWDNLRMGDALNNAGSHIRLYDYFTNHTHTAMLYESTSGSGLIWAMVQRSLARDNNYQPIRYNNPSGYKVFVFPEPVILYIVKTGTERVSIRWDGQADIGFRLYRSLDGSTWTLIRDHTDLTPSMRYCEVSGLLPDATYYFKMTSYNTGPAETIDSNVVPWRLDGFGSRVILVDGADRYREQKGAPHVFLTRVGKALASRGIGFDFCSNECIVDQQIALTNYGAAVWILAEESTVDETFSWAEQLHVQNFLEAGGSLFVSGSEIGWDLDYRHNSTTYKNGSVNDRPFYNDYLRASYVGDYSNTYNVTGAVASIFAGLNFSFDDGTHGTYNVEYPDRIDASNDAVVGMTYQGGLGGAACVYGSKTNYGSVVNMGFPYETINNESDRFAVIKAILNYFDLPNAPPTIKTARETASDAVTIIWDGHASQGFRLFQKTGAGSWNQIKNESDLNSDARSVTITGLSNLTRYAFKLQAVNSGGASADSDVMCVSLGSSGNKILLVDGYDRYNGQYGGANHTLLENFADALSANSQRYDSCANEAVTNGTVSLFDYNVVMWMCGEESTESETFSYAEQIAVQDYLKAGGKVFVSGAEIGWDLVHKADASNDYSNGHPNDAPFYNDYLKAGFLDDDAGVYTARGVSGGPFDGVTINFDNGTYGTYDVKYPDVISTYGGSSNALYYGASGTDVAGITFSGTVSGGGWACKIIYFGFPFETIYNQTNRATVMEKIMDFFGDPGPMPTSTPTPTPTQSPTPTQTPTPTPTPDLNQYLVDNWEGYSNGVSAVFRNPGYSGSTTGIDSGDTSAVSDEQANNILDPALGDPGTRSYKVTWQWTTPGSGYIRLTTYNTANKPNPILDLSKGLSLYLKLPAGQIDLKIQIRETGVEGSIGENGGATGPIERSEVAVRIDSSGDWQYVYFDIPNLKWEASTGNGVLDGDWGTLEALSIYAVSGDPTKDFILYLDDIYQGPEQEPGESPPSGINLWKTY